MTNIKMDITNFDTGSAPTEFDLICLEKIDHTDKVTNYSLVTIQWGDQKLKIRFDWKEEQEITSSDFVFMPESKTVFFRSRNQWGAIDLENKMIKRHEHSMWMPAIERKGNFVLIQDDLTAESTRLNGDKIHAVPIDPPIDCREFDDRIEYDSPIFGHQVLKTR